MAKELSLDEINELLAGSPRAGKKRDTTEPRVVENWWNQNLSFVDQKDNPELCCGNVNCSDPRGNERIKSLALIKGRLMCRFCFLDGWLSGKDYD